MMLLDVTYTLTGMPDAWVYDFTVTNESSTAIVAFGVSVGDFNSQPYWQYLPNSWIVYYGGIQPTGVGDIIYNYDWIEGSLAPGQTKSDFAFIYQEIKPIHGAISWFANPPDTTIYLRGMAHTVPEPATWLLMLIGLAAAAYIGRRREHRRVGIIRALDAPKRAPERRRSPIALAAPK
jgi:hypothetical protein